MRKEIAYLTLLFVGSLFLACGSDKEDVFQPLEVMIENLSGATACIPGEEIRLKAKVNSDLPTTCVWFVEGKEVAIDSLYSFSSQETGSFVIVLEAINENGTDMDTLTLHVTTDSIFTINHVRNWTGTGDSRAVLAIQWVTGDHIEQPTDEEVTFLAWGYRWQSTTGATGIDMLKAIVKQDPRLYVILAEQWGGILVKGWGYDGNNDGCISIKNSSLSLTQSDFSNGIYWQKITDDIDGLKSENTSDYWLSGWQKIYSTYWIGSGEIVPMADEYEYSNHAPSFRSLRNNDWDVYTFSTINAAERNVSPIPRLLKAASLLF